MAKKDMTKVMVAVREAIEVSVAHLKEDPSAELTGLTAKVHGPTDL